MAVIAGLFARNFHTVETLQSASDYQEQLRARGSRGVVRTGLDLPIDRFLLSFNSGMFPPRRQW